ncbi:spinocerebellar ataxia type 10 protein domain-containing protein [Umbelopsis sp. PMI_123]|nr:spinocerebellar ataxia type 10 protein domain-containing protein [Umbelopsis sp. PMI_123]
MTSIKSLTLELQQQFLTDRSNASVPLFSECLEKCATQVIRDPGLRSELGSYTPFWQHTCQCIDTVRDELAQDQDDDEIRVLLVNNLRLVRNIVANDPNNQATAGASGISNHVENLLAWCLLENMPENRPLTRMGVQALCNMITGNPKQQNILWTVWMNDVGYSALFARMLSKSDDITLMSTLVLIFNCIKNDNGRSRMLVESQTGKVILNCLLKNAELVLDDQNTQNFELIFAIFEQIVETGLFSKVFKYFDSKEGVALSSNQTILLKLYDSAIHRQQSHISLNESDESLLITTLRDTCAQAVEVLRKLPNVSTSALGSGDTDVEKNMTESGASSDDQGNVRMMVEDTANAYTGVILMLQTIGTMTVDCRCSGELKNVLISSGCLKTCLDLLAQAERKIPRITKSMGDIVSDTDTSKGSVGFMYIKRDIVRLTSALAYHDRRMQDEVRELGGIGLVLSQCNIDDANPYVKEHAILAMRNLLENNLENQAVVEQLSPQGTVPHPVLEEIGLKTELNGGRVNISRDRV